MLLSSILIIMGVLFSEQDTLNYKTDDIEVSQSNILMLNQKIINNEEIKRINAQDLGEAIIGKSSISLRDYGGAGGMKTISLRGSNSNQIAYIYDGFKINDKSSGGFNSALLNTNNISNIEINSVGNSSIYGSNALFGTIKINSKVPQNKIINFNAGSFNNYSSSIIYPINSTTSVSIDYKNNKANYPININIDNKEKELKRKNSELNNINFNFTKILINNNFSHKIRYFFNYTEQGIPGAVIQDKLENNSANLINNNNYIYYNFDYKNDKLNINNGFYYNYSELKYQDTLNKIINSDGINNNYYTNNIQLFSELNNNNKYFNYKIRIDNDLILLKGDNLFNNKNIIGNIFGISSNINKLININDNLINFNFGLRYDIINYTNNNLSAMFSTTLFSKYYNGEISFSRNFRAPSFNEMYYFNYGNTNLIPEISNTINFNNKFKINKYINLSINPYYSLVDNYIMSIPLSPVLWSATNYEKVINYGIENVINFNYKNIIFNFNYTYQKAIFKENNILKNTDLPYIPNEIINSNIYFKNKYVNINLLLNYNSFRYFNQGNDINSIIDSFTLIDLILYKKIYLFKNKFNIIFSIKNILNNNYQVVHNYPMPGINFLLSLNYELK